MGLASPVQSTAYNSATCTHMPVVTQSASEPRSYSADPVKRQGNRALDLFSQAAVPAVSYGLDLAKRQRLHGRRPP